MKTIKNLIIIIFIAIIILNNSCSNKSIETTYNRDSLEVVYNKVRNKHFTFDYKLLSHYHFKSDSFEITLIEGYSKNLNYISIHKKR